MKELNKFVNNVVGSQFAKTYGTFISFTDPIVLDHQIESMVEKAFKLLPEQCKLIMTLYGFASRLNTTRSNHLRKFYNRMTFYTIVALARTRFNQNFVPWAMIGAAAAYGQSDKQAGRRVPVFFGHSCSYTSFQTQSKEYRNIPVYYKKVEAALSLEKFSYVDHNGSTFTINVLMSYTMQGNITSRGTPHHNGLVLIGARNAAVKAILILCKNKCQ